MHKKNIHSLEVRVKSEKATYNEALRNLEQISDDIHKSREEQKIKDEATIVASEEFKTPSSSFNTYLRYENSVSDEFEMDCLETNTDTTDMNKSPCETEYWSEIRLSDSQSSTSSSSYSHNHVIDDKSNNESETIDDNQLANNKPIEDDNDDNKEDKKYSGISDWISKSSLRSTGRRQSLDLLLDTSDRVKDAFTFSFQKIGIGKTLERRNSESEVNTEKETAKEYFMFSR